MCEKAAGGGGCSPRVILGTDTGLKLLAVAGHVLGQLVDDRLDVWRRRDDGGRRSCHGRGWGCRCWGDWGDWGLVLYAEEDEREKKVNLGEKKRLRGGKKTKKHKHTQKAMNQSQRARLRD